MNRAPTRMFVVGLSATLFVFSLTQVGFYTAQRNAADGAHPSIALFLIGWMGMIDGKIAWYANPALFAGWRITQRLETRPISLLYPLVSLGLSASFLAHDEIMVNEGGGRAPIVGYGAGYWLWLSSIGVLLFGNTLLFFTSLNRPPMPEMPGASHGA